MFVCVIDEFQQTLNNLTQPFQPKLGLAIQGFRVIPLNTVGTNYFAGLKALARYPGLLDVMSGSNFLLTIIFSAGLYKNTIG